MLCAKCGADNPAGKRFCGDCGAPLANRCERCGAENPPEKKFCGDCGSALGKVVSAVVATSPPQESAPKVRVTSEQPDASSTLDGERKTVTALFADIKGSTELMEDLDPEEARAIIDPALKLMIDAVHRYDGYIVQSTGDGIFALFGAPLAHEDHPQRALYAALRMQEELKRYSAKVVAEGSSPIQGRVGINTGEVVVRSIQTGAGQSEYTPIGHTTNLASRMQTAAPVGSIAVSEATRRLCEGYFALKPLGATKVKGVSEPVNVFEATGLGPLRTRLQRAVGRGLTKFVGREREMDVLKRAAEQAKAGHGQIVAAMAEAGTGKSRLFYEFKVKNQSGWMVLEAYSVSHGKASAYLPVIELLRNYFDISGADDERKRREKVAGKLSMLDPSLDETRPYLFSLLGTVDGGDPLAQMDGQIRKRRTLEAIKRIVLRESLNQPLMVIFEDLHWIDDQTQELLNLLADSIGTATILFLVNYRPEYSHQWNSKTYYTQVRLDPLARESADEMLSALLGDGKDLVALKRLIVERTEANPFFMEEIVQALFEDGVLQRNGTVKLARSMNAVKVPATVHGVLAARIDRLPAEEKELLQTLAVLGREFPFELVRRATLRPDDELERGLSRLQAGEFIYEQPVSGDVEYVFKHALTQEVAYNALLLERRKLLHERAGHALESRFGGQLEDHLDELAHHYRRSDNVEKAVEYLGRAGQQAALRSAYGDAINGLAAAIDLIQKLPDDRDRIQRELLLQLSVGPALFAVKGWGSQEVVRAYTRARELCELLGDPLELFPALFGLWALRVLRGELRTARELAEQLIRRAQSANDTALLLYAHHALGQTSSWMGELPDGSKHLEKAFRLYDPKLHQPLTFRYAGFDCGVHSLTVAGVILWYLGYPDRAVTRVNQGLTLAQGLAHPHSLVFAEYMVSTMHQIRRDVRAARQAAEKVIALSAEHGFPDYLAFMTIQRGWAIVEQERHEEGIAQIQEGLATARARGAELLRPYFLCLLAEAYGKSNRLEEGLGVLEEALAELDVHGNRMYEPEIYCLKGELLLKERESSATEAQSCFQHAIEVARKQSAKSLELRATASLARLLASQGKRDEARTTLAEAYNWFTEGFDTADLKDAKGLLDELSG